MDFNLSKLIFNKDNNLYKVINNIIIKLLPLFKNKLREKTLI